MSCEAVVELLATQTWQVAVLAGFVWAFAKLFARDRPHLAHCVWALVLLKCVTPPVWSSPIGAFSLMGRGLAVSQSSAKPEGSSGGRELADGSGQSPRLMVEVEPAAGGLVVSTERLSVSPGAASTSPAAQQTTSFAWQEIAVYTWIGGALAVLAVTLCRLGFFWHWLRRQTRVADTATASLVQRLARNLGVNRRVHVCVVGASVGPAVTGLLRPMIVLPKAIVSGRTETEIAPLLAHELVHVRRGDLWWSALQSLATCLCWFHPLVWLAARMLSRESERSCDEETIASLGCSPSTYARCLLDVLERKHLLRVAPALPGVRPVDVTASRLERVMRLGQGCHRRSPKWVAIVLLVGAIGVLPGAAWVVAKEDARATLAARNSASPEEGTIYPHPIPVAQSAIDRPERISDADASAFRVESHDVSDLLQDVRESGVAAENAAEALVGRLPSGKYWTDGKPTTPQGIFIQFAVDGHAVCHLGGAEPPVKVVGSRLYVFGTDEHRQQIRESVGHLRQYGFAQLELQIELLTIPPEMMASLNIEWSIAAAADQEPLNLPLALTGFRGLAGGGATADPASSSSLIRPAAGRLVPTPLLSCVLSDNQTRALLAEVRNDPRGNVLSRPRIRLSSGQDAQVQVCTQRPFVTGVQPYAATAGETRESFQSIISVVPEGTAMELKPVVSPDRSSVELEFALQHSAVRDVDTFSFKRPGGKAGDTLTLQVPDAITRVLRTTASLPTGATLAVSGIKMDADGKQAVLLALVTCELVDDAAAPLSRESEPRPSGNASRGQSLDEKHPAKDIGNGRQYSFLPTR